MHKNKFSRDVPYYFNCKETEEEKTHAKTKSSSRKQWKSNAIIKKVIDKFLNEGQCTPHQSFWKRILKNTESNTCYMINCNLISLCSCNASVY